MPGLLDVSHCEPCGNCGCVLAGVEAFNNVCPPTVGFVYTNNNWITSTPGSYNYTTVSTLEPWVIKTNWVIDWTHQTGNSITLRVHGGIKDTDCNDYWFCDLTIFETPQGYKYTFNIGTFNNGLEIIVPQVPHFLSPIPFFPSGINFNGVFHLTITMCWDGSKLSAWCDQLSPEYGSSLQYNNLTAPFGGKAGFSVRAMTAGVTSVKVIGSIFEYTESEDNVNCKKCFPSCCEGLAPLSFNIEISGISDEIGVAGSNCAFECSSLFGTYNIITTLGDATCFWVKGFTVVDSSVLCHGSLTKSYSISLRIGYYSPITNLREIAVEIIFSPGGFLNPLSVAYFSLFTDEPCDNWDDWIELPNLEGFCPVQSESYTCRIKKGS